jgi:hypothetical protein
MLARNHKPSGHNGKEIAKYFVPAIEIRGLRPGGIQSAGADQMTFGPTDKSATSSAWVR